MILESDSNTHTPVKSKITNLEKQSNPKIVFNTIDELSSHAKLYQPSQLEEKLIHEKINLTQDGQNYSEDSSDDADIDDSMCIDEAPVSQKAIN